MSDESRRARFNELCREFALTVEQHPEYASLQVAAWHWYNLGVDAPSDPTETLADVIEVAHLYELNGTDTDTGYGYGKTVGYYANRALASEAAKGLGHMHFDCEDVPALRLANGDVYLLASRNAVTVAPEVRVAQPSPRPVPTCTVCGAQMTLHLRERPGGPPGNFYACTVCNP